MKKRMFITTIVMMLVLAVALTTSSLAWFSSANTSVTANAATFTAAAASTSNVNLKISDTTGGWGNQISLTSGGRTMAALVPTAPLISAAEVGADITTTGVTINEAHTDVIHKGYTWPARMAFNGAKIGSESNFIIDDGNNQVNNVTNYTLNSSEGYYYDEFYIQNAGNENTIGSLTFKVDAQLSNLTGTGAQAGDYTARGYAAFILFDLVNVPAGSTVPANALQSANLTVVAFGTTVGDGQIEETDTDKGLDVWVPFAAFTFATKKGDTDTYQETDWQFADLDAKTGDTYNWNNKNINSLPTQQYEALTGIGNDDGFTLNTASLKALNNKVANPAASGDYAAGSVRNDGAGYVRAENVDSESVFIMQPGEIFKVAMYYWLDGMSLTEYTDTTVSEVGVVIEASRS